MAVFINDILEGAWVWSPSGKDGRWYHWSPQVHEVIPRIISTKIQMHIAKVMDKLGSDELNTLLDSKGMVVEAPMDLPDMEHEMMCLEEDSSSQTSSDGERQNHRRGRNIKDRASSARREKMSTVGKRLQTLKEGCQLVCFKTRKIRELKESKLNSSQSTMG